ncbi:BT_3928 family protein [Thermophagus xiamenensis]|uniref:Triosephosphate isomerase (TIM) n=1 Tax=Thermophagus xiamenensis TaxID=385682 RepID=A0A1I2D844_9BACT|nr:BT_3928 family protein [Thermophagus xiamenensis]SFE76130.1 triosephosphate isomerase (TIM) [Thermophagus xiamenensis]
MWNFLRTFSRILVGLTFVFSGFVKAVDPVGSSIKFQDYFQAFHFEWLSPLSLPLGIGLAALEFVMGVLLVFNVFPRLATTAAFYFLSFFTLLTLILAIFNPVTDCGCFGDAIKLTNWQTFWKNMIIMVFATFLFFNKDNLICSYSLKRQTIFGGITVIWIISIAIYSLNHLPILDFRPYAIGTHIPSGMEIPEGAPQPEYKTTFILEKDNIRKEFTEENYPYDDTTWVFIDSKTKVISEGYQPPIHDFVLQHPLEGNITDRLMDLDVPLFLVISSDITRLKEETALQLAELQQTANMQNAQFYVVTSSTLAEAEKINQEYQINFTFLQGDETNLKTIIRSNPGLVMILKGTVVGKWHFKDLPKPSQMEHPLSLAIQQQQKKKNNLLIFGQMAALVFAAAMILNFRIK